MRRHPLRALRHVSGWIAGKFVFQKEPTETSQQSGKRFLVYISDIFHAPGKLFFLPFFFGGGGGWTSQLTADGTIQAQREGCHLLASWGEDDPQYFQQFGPEASSNVVHRKSSYSRLK